MENSVSSSEKIIISSSTPIIKADSEQEESGWTQYIDDFTTYSEDDSSYLGWSGSMVSDAGSGPEWKNKSVGNKGLCSNPIGILPNMPKRLNFKKKIAFDDSLEDTASSPVNSPKITAYFNRMDINSRKMENESGNHMVPALECSNKLTEHGDEMSIDKDVEYNDINKDDEMKGNLRNNVECIQLKQKGLCLVPVSMVLNYLG